MAKPTRTVKKMKWIGGLKFEGTTVYGKKIVTDSSKETGGEEDGYSPSELVLFGLAGCTGIDVLLIMQKQKQKVESMEVEIVAHQNEDYPRPFHTIEVKFIVKGDNVDERKLLQAIELSQNKYCVVSQSLKIPVKLTSSYQIR
ncbi:MAG: OsmC family protein [Candidatus Zixiibacteriota bacterium]